MIPIKKYWITFPPPSPEHEESSHSSMRFYSKNKWSPDTDIYEVADGLLLIMDIAGMKRDEINISVESSVLTVSGIRKEPHIADKKTIYRLEVDYGHFEKRFRLPEFIEPRNIEARYDNGFLHVRLPRMEKRKIDITDG